MVYGSRSVSIDVSSIQILSTELTTRFFNNSRANNGILRSISLFNSLFNIWLCSLLSLFLK